MCRLLCVPIKMSFRVFLMCLLLVHSFYSGWRFAGPLSNRMVFPPHICCKTFRLSIPQHVRGYLIKLLPGPCSVGPRTVCLFWNDDLQRGVWRSISLSVQRSGNDVLRVCARTRPGVEDECVGANVTAMFKVMRHLFWPCERVQCLK